MVPQNFRINDVKSLDTRILHDEYFDFMLYKGDVYGTLSDESLSACNAAYIDFSDEACYTSGGGIQSIVSWAGTSSDTVDLENIGMTAMDNGLITFDKDTIDYRLFYELFFNSKMSITSADTMLQLYAVNGNTKKYSYDISIDGNDKKYLSCKGGFLQGFYKVEGTDYQVLPNYIEDEWNFEFVIRPRSDYDTEDNILNETYPNNNGIFFYIGTRAENKFAELMNRTSAYTDNYRPEILSATLFTDDYSENDINFSAITLTADTRYTEIETDNKFILFNRTKTGFTTDDWDKNIYKVKLAGNTRYEYKTNAFLLFNRTKSGITTDTVDEYIDESWDETNDYNIMKDVIGNAFSLKYNQDGSISYRYTMKDCDSSSGYSLQEETTMSGLVKDNEWSVINVKFTILDNSYSQCETKDSDGNLITKNIINNIGSRKMRISIYINGYLVFLSKELNEFLFWGLNDMPERQQGVPFNISLGGGTQGLGERIWLDYLLPVKRHYFLEENYAGSFIGDVQSFKIYTCKLNYPTIKNNYYNIINN